VAFTIDYIFSAIDSLLRVLGVFACAFLLPFLPLLVFYKISPNEALRTIDRWHRIHTGQLVGFIITAGLILGLTDTAFYGIKYFMATNTYVILGLPWVKTIVWQFVECWLVFSLSLLVMELMDKDKQDETQAPSEIPAQTEQA
jgi:hypothetical protein